jgi:hypothetical protein
MRLPLSSGCVTNLNVVVRNRMLKKQNNNKLHFLHYLVLLVGHEVFGAFEVFATTSKNTSVHPALEVLMEKTAEHLAGPLHALHCALTQGPEIQTFAVVGEAGDVL